MPAIVLALGNSAQNQQHSEAPVLAKTLPYAEHAHKEPTVIEIALWFNSVLLLCLLVNQIVLHVRAKSRTAEFPLIQARFDSLERTHVQVDRSLRDELARNRQELGTESKDLRAEVNNSLKSVADSVLTHINASSSSTDQRLGVFGRNVEERLDAVGQEMNLQLELVRNASGEAAAKLQTQVSEELRDFRTSLQQISNDTHDIQREQTMTLRTAFDCFQSKLEEKFNGFGTAVGSKLLALQQETTTRLSSIETVLARGAQEMRQETGSALKNFNDSVLKTMVETAALQNNQLQEVRMTVSERLQAIQNETQKKLEEVRNTVDEKLQGTLEARLGESFRLVSERLEQVHRGLGEMQSLASGVGDLKRVLTNVKARGTWGEVQLGNLLEQIFAPEQYEKNVSPKGNGEYVEFAVRLPGRDGSNVVWLPIDSKFPVEDYQRLVEASDRGDGDGMEAASRQLEIKLKAFAKDFSEKYLAPPVTTDFGILFVPTEGLYAEVLRRPGLAEFLQREHRVSISGPTTLAALLNSLQMGFRTLAIQQRSSEVWELLAAVKTEFGKYGDVLGKIKKKLEEASNTIDKATVRTRAIERRLRAVETPVDETLQIVSASDDDSDLEDVNVALVSPN